mmetsp:Transcript_14174/g.24046  ORF Transcript_14174/g.24046 Transcript_14174/m.24046 type:complete len:214 (+) Transcript_14174:158-799(+)
MNMNLLNQPFLDRRKFSFRNQLIKLRNVLFAVMAQLRRRGGTKQIGWEITESKSRPMNILQATFFVVGNLNIQQRLHVILPSLRNLRHFHVAFDDVSLDAIPHDNMKRIGQFICLHSNQRRRYNIHSFVHFLRGHPIKLGWKLLLPFWQGPLPERKTQTNVTLPEQRLRFVSTHRQGRVQTSCRSADVLLVHCMTTFMDHCRKALIPFILAVS